MTTLYFAGPLFTQGERLWNADMAARLRGLGFAVILPQETAEAMLQGAALFNPRDVFTANVRDIGRSDAVVAVLDGADPDSGTCWECGYAYGTGKPVVGVRTDFRASGDDPDVPVNLMLSCSCIAFVELPLEHAAGMDWLAGRVVEAVRESLPSG